MEIRKRKGKQVGRFTVYKRFSPAKLNVEVQRSDKGGGRKRARYNSSMMDANLLKKGEDFDKLPETWVFFITEIDVMGTGRSFYPIKRCFLGTFWTVKTWQ